MIYFYESAFPVYEFQCVELVLRFMYQAYGVAPYMANGNGIVSNYSGTSLVKIANHTTGKAPQPGDILSYCPGCTYGHTSVVISSIVDSSGNGSIDVMEQNWTANGQTNLKVSNWTVIGDAGWIYAWLHPVYLNVILPTPTPTPTQTRTPYPTLESTMTLSITPTPGSPTGNPVHIYFPFTFNTGY
jgi:surface antigen